MVFTSPNTLEGNYSHKNAVTLYECQNQARQAHRYPVHTHTSHFSLEMCFLRESCVFPSPTCDFPRQLRGCSLCIVASPINLDLYQSLPLSFLIFSK